MGEYNFEVRNRGKLLLPRDGERTIVVSRRYVFRRRSCRGCGFGKNDLF
jgi:hypothetical protein